LIDELRELLPEEFHHAELLLADRESVVTEGRQEAERIVAEAYATRDRLVSETEVVAESLRVAEANVAAAADEARSMRDEVDDYVDTKLANFEVVLTKTLAAVERGRDRLRERAVSDEVPEGDGAGNAYASSEEFSG
jgi:F0F1-type ATP synthase membrane subunit b/b'